jgi:predicted RNase H-like nuclease (RuvC/YqgF family)
MGEREVDRILDGFSMASFDFVIDPSVQPAAIRKVMENAVQKYVTEGTMDIKSVDDLRMQFPDLVKEVEEKVIEDAEKVMAQELEEKNKQLAKELEDLKASMEDLKQKQVKEQEDEAGTKYVSFMNDLVDLLVEYGVLSSEAEAETDEPGTEEVPAGESKEVGMTDEEKRELENLKTVVTSLEDENKALKAKADEFDKAKAEAEAKAQEAEVQAEAEKKKSAELEEQQKVMSYIDEKLSGSKFATILKPRLEGCKTTEAVDEKMKAEESFIKSLEEQFGGQVPHAKGKTEMAGGDSEVQAIREKAKRVAGLTK